MSKAKKTKLVCKVCKKSLQKSDDFVQIGEIVACIGHHGVKEWAEEELGEVIGEVNEHDKE